SGDGRPARAGRGGTRMAYFGFPPTPRAWSRIMQTLGAQLRRVSVGRRLSAPPAEGRGGTPPLVGGTADFRVQISSRVRGSRAYLKGPNSIAGARSGSHPDPRR